jgi:hyperosmotically inducible protein
MNTRFRTSVQLTAFAAILIAPMAVTQPILASGQAQVSDDTLKDRIAYRLETADAVKKYDLHVKVDAGVVMLKGTVATAAQKAEAGTLANIKGVTKVDNQIAIDKDADVTLSDHAKAGLRRTGEAITDTWITTKVKWFYMGDSLMDGGKVDVNTSNRVVTLGGTVKTPAAKIRAVALANSTDGVMKVVDTLVVVK